MTFAWVRISKAAELTGYTVAGMKAFAMFNAEKKEGMG